MPPSAAKSVGNESYSLLDTLRGDDQNVIMQVRYPRSSEGAGTQVVSVDTISGRRTPWRAHPKRTATSHWMAPGNALRGLQFQPR